MRVRSMHPAWIDRLLGPRVGISLSPERMSVIQYNTHVYQRSRKTYQIIVSIVPMNSHTASPTPWCSNLGIFSDSELSIAIFEITITVSFDGSRLDVSIGLAR